jgi:hypothetical protein
LRLGSRGSIATISAIGYTAFLGTPPVIGAIAERTSVGAALWVVVAICAVSAGSGRLARSALGDAPTGERRDDAVDAAAR